MTEQGQLHAHRVVEAVSMGISTKYRLGQAQHGGHLPDKGGLLAESWAEVIDLAVYLQTVREQLVRIEKWVEDGKTEQALVALNLLLRGTPLDTFPAD